MGDYFTDVKTALQHRHHLVPGLVHLTSVDALYRQAVEDDLVPVDDRTGLHKPEQRDFAAVVHHVYHAGEGLRTAGHLQPDVEALLHAELVHHVAEILLIGAHGARGAELFREIEAVIVKVADDDVSRADVAADRGGHHADGARARDEDVLTDEIVLQRRMGGVAERVEAGDDIVGDIGGAAPDIRRWYRKVLREGAVTVHADADRMWAVVAASGETIAALAADDVSLARDALADLPAAHMAAELDDLSNIFVADGHGGLDGLLRPLIPIIDVEIRSADRRLLYLYQNVVGTGLGNVNLAHP